MAAYNRCGLSPRFHPSLADVLYTFTADLTERKEADEALKLASMVYEKCSEAILITDMANRIIAVNPAFEAMTGYTIEDVGGKSSRILPIRVRCFMSPCGTR